MQNAKNIVVITGSPRRNGNSFAMTRAFTQACELRGYSVTRFDAAFMNVEGCMACGSCYGTEKACISRDDFNTIAAALEKADFILLSCPVYWYSIPAKIKAVIDKFFAFYILGMKDNRMKGKRAGLLACWEEKDMWVGEEAVLKPYLRTLKLLEWSSAGEVLIPGVLDAGAIKNTDGEQRAAALAERI